MSPCVPFPLRPAYPSVFPLPFRPNPLPNPSGDPDLPLVAAAMKPFRRWLDLPPNLLWRIGNRLDLKWHASARGACTVRRCALAPPSPAVVSGAAASAPTTVGSRTPQPSCSYSIEEDQLARRGRHRPLHPRKRSWSRMPKGDGNIRHAEIHMLLRPHLPPPSLAFFSSSGHGSMATTRSTDPRVPLTTAPFSLHLRI